MGIGIYFLAVILAWIAEGIFTILEIDVYLTLQGYEVDMATYIVVGAINLIIWVLELIIRVGLVLFFWLLNTFVIELFIRGILHTVIVDYLTLMLFLMCNPSQVQRLILLCMGLFQY